MGAQATPANKSLELVLDRLGRIRDKQAWPDWPLTDAGTLAVPEENDVWVEVNLTDCLRAEGEGVGKTLSLQLEHTGPDLRGVTFSFDKGQPDKWPQLVLRLSTAGKT